MQQTDLALDKPRPGELFSYGSQCYRLYERLLDGPVDNGEMLFSLRLGSHTRRVSDLREKLRPYLMDVEARPDPQKRSRVVYRLKGGLWAS